MFFEVLLNGKAFHLAGYRGRDELEDPLEGTLRERGLGEVTGGGGGEGVMNIDVEMSESLPLDRAADALLAVLRELGAPPGTVVKSGNPGRKSWTV